MKTKKLLSVILMGGMILGLVPAEAQSYGNYPIHTEITSDPSGWVNNTNMTVGASPAENVFYVEDENGEERSFVLLDKDEEGNYFVITEENYGTHQYTDYLYSEILSMPDSEWAFNPENEKSVAYWLENDFWNNGNGGIALPDAIKDNIIEKEWQIENNYTVNSVNESHAKYAEAQAWVAERAPLRTVNSKLSLISWTEYKTYKDKISSQLQQWNATWTGMMMRSVMSTVSESGDNLAYKQRLAFLCASEESTSEWVGYTKITNNGYPRGKFDGDMNYADGDKASFYIRPVFWLGKDFFKDVRVNLEKSGTNPKAEIQTCGYYDLWDIYSDEEIEGLGIELGEIGKYESIDPMAGYGIYPAHTEITSDPSGWVNNDGMIVGASPEVNVFSVADDNGNLRSFVLLDKDEEGNYFVIAEENYGTHQYTDYLYSEILSMPDSEWAFNPDNEKSVAYWLENDFWNNGNGGIAFPEAIKDNIIEKEWQIENNYTVNSVNESHAKYAEAQAWVAERAPLRTVNSKLSLMSWTEYKTYKDKISPQLQQYNSTWTGMMMRSVMSTVSESGDNLAYKQRLAFLCASEDSGYEWIGYMNIWNNGYPRGKFDGDMNYADGDKASFYIRPVFWLDKDFFAEVKVDAQSLGANVAKQILQYNMADVEDIYSAEELALIGYDVEKMPVIENLTFGVPAVGMAVIPEYTFVPFNEVMTEGETLYQWYIADAVTDEFVKIEGATKKSYIPSENDIGKYIKVEITPIDIGGYIGRRIESAPRCVTKNGFAEWNISIVDELDKPIEGINGTSYIKGNVYFESAIETEMDLIISVYDAENRLVSTNCKTVDVIVGENNLSHDIELENACGSGYNCKVMVWENVDTMKPYYVKVF